MALQQVLPLYGLAKARETCERTCVPDRASSEAAVEISSSL
jgi:hypothetical protein